MENNELREKINKSLKRKRIINNVMLTVPIVILVIIVLTAIFASFIATHPPNENALRERLLPPAFMEGGTTAHLLGTDHLGRDLFSRLVYGAQISLAIGMTVAAINMIVGTIIGIASGYFGGRFDNFMMRIVDVLLAFPALIIQLLLAATLGQKVSTILLAFTVTGWAAMARSVRGLALAIRNQDFVAQAYINGCSSFRIMLKHIFPNLVNFVVIIASLSVPNIIMGEAVLSYLGIGFPPPTPSWGAITQGGMAYMPDFWWIAVFPSIFIGLLVLCMFYLGNWLQDRMDPMLRQM